MISKFIYSLFFYRKNTPKKARIFIESDDFIEGTMLEINNGARLVLPYYLVNLNTNMLTPEIVDLKYWIEKKRHSINGNPFIIALRAVALSFVLFIIPLICIEFFNGRGFRGHWSLWDIIGTVMIYVFLSAFYTSFMTSTHEKYEITLTDGKKFEVTMESQYGYIIDKLIQESEYNNPHTISKHFPNKETQEQLLIQFLLLKK